MKHILLICYTFPPNPGIGGRRWAKFSKFLTKENYSIDVFNAKLIDNYKSLWLKDVENNAAITIYSHLFFLQKLIVNPVSFTQKVFKRLIFSICQFLKINPNIITSFPNRKIYKAVEQHVTKNNIQTVIVSGDPYLFYYTSKLKKKINFNLILDYRDLWNDHSFYGKNIRFTKKQKRFFEFAENYAVNNCDTILFVDKGLESIVKKRITNTTIKTYVLHNGFDESDYDPIIKKNNYNNDDLKLIFAGNISSDVNEIFTNFLNSFYKLSIDNINLYNKITIEIISNIDAQLLDDIKQLGLKNVFCNNTILPFEQYKKHVLKKDIGLIHLSNEYKNSFATKFGDFLNLDLFIVSIGYRGDFAEFIESNKIGLHYDMNSDSSFFEKLNSAFLTRKKIDNALLNTFNLQNITTKLIEIINYD